MEGDQQSEQLCCLGERFQSTPSAWRETMLIVKKKIDEIISIHSLRMEGDLFRRQFGRI